MSRGLDATAASRRCGRSPAARRSVQGAEGENGPDSSSAVKRSRLRRWAADSVVRLYRATYARLCGSHPDLRPCHFQWLAGSVLYSSLHQVLLPLGGRVLDVGCGDKPYKQWMPLAESYVGMDVKHGPEVDVVIEPGARWPVADAEFDVVLCTQVLEHVEDLDHTLAELERVLRPGGQLVATVPFIYNEHGSPHDYRRCSAAGLTNLLRNDLELEIVEVRRQGGAGSSIGVMLLNYVEVCLTASAARTLALLFALPLWIACTMTVNAIGWLVDRLDSSGLFYGNVLVVAAKPSGGTDR